MDIQDANTLTEYAQSMRGGATVHLSSDGQHLVLNCGSHPPLIVPRNSWKDQEVVIKEYLSREEAAPYKDGTKQNYVGTGWD